MSSRQALKAALQEQMPETILVTADAGNLTTLDPSMIGGVQIVGGGWAPAPYEGQMVANWELWLYIESTDPEIVEDQLESLWAEVHELINGIGWIDWTAAEITAHPDGPQAVRVTAQTITTTSS